jgi:predicted nucleic acid-binding protein
MESALLGLVLDSSVLITAERRKLTPAQVIETVQEHIGEIPVVLCSLTVAEIGHGIYRAEIRTRRWAFLDELKAAVPIYPVTGATAEIVARIGVRKPLKESFFHSAISLSELAPWSLGMRWAPVIFAILAASPD